MPFFPSVISAPPLKTALQQWLEPPDAGPVWFEGPERIRRTLLLQQYRLVQDSPVRQVLWVNFLPKTRAQAVQRLQEAALRLTPGGRILAVTPTVAPEEKSLIARLQIAIGLYTESAVVSSWFMEAGLAPLVQVWPQGLRSCVLTVCSPGAPVDALLLEPSLSQSPPA